MKCTQFLTLFAFVWPVFAGTEVLHTRYRDETARAEYSWVENCTSYQLTVTASKTKVKDDGVTVDNGPVVSVTYATYTFCDIANTEQTFWSGTAASPALEIDSNLKTARVAVVLPLQGTRYKAGQSTALGTRTVSVDMAWTSDEKKDTYSGTIVTRYPGHTEVNHLTGHYRIAAASGTVSDGQMNLLAGAPAGWAQLFRLNQGETIITKD
jgi:hypothetical protein